MNDLLIPSEYARLLDGDWREAAVYGGRFSLKSNTVANVLLARSMQKKTRIACFREYQNSIADSSHQLLSDIILKHGLWMFRVTDNAIYNTVNGSDFLFKGLHHNIQNIKSIEGIDVAWIEESQTISEDSIEVLTPTVRKEGSQIVYTFNRLKDVDPIYKRLVIEGRPNTLIIKQNYDIAIKYGMMPDAIRQEIEDDKEHRPKLYNYKWLGEPQAVEGRIYSGWREIDEIPHEAKLWRRGLDFGYTNDPTVIVSVYIHNGAYIVDENVWRRGMSNQAIADTLKNLEGQCLVIADGAEPKSIDEIASYGISIVPSKKGQGSRQQGIQVVQDQKISITKHSFKTIESYNNYVWALDRMGRPTNEPDDTIHEWSNSMDAIRYAFNGTIPQGDDKKYEHYKQPISRDNLFEI